jgi:cytochrome c-type biogenesis protein CcmH
MTTTPPCHAERRAKNPRRPPAAPPVILSVERRIRTLFAASLVVLLLLAPATALAQTYSGAQTIDDQALAIANELQCPVCENVTVAYSNAELAGQMRQVIRDDLAKGWTHDQIIQYFVDRYGEAILTQPPKHGLNLLVWLLPALGLALGLTAVGITLRGRPSSGPESDPPPLTDDDERLLATALEGAD